MRNFKDESFVAQYLSPRLIREFKLFAVLDDDAQEQLEISAIHDERGYRYIRQSLADQYNLGSREPNIQVYNVNRRGDRSLTLRHMQYNRRPLAESAEQVVKHIARLWGFTVKLESVVEDDKIEVTCECKSEHGSQPQ
jgi:stage V sporulation protein R